MESENEHLRLALQQQEARQKDKIAEHVKYAVEAADKTVVPETAAAVQKSKPAVEMQTATTSISKPTLIFQKVSR